MSFAVQGLGPCVQCGFCLQSCPTYLVTGDEADSPRGRIVLMRAMATGTLDAGDADASRHLDRCLGCRACEPVCPSGVVYGEPLENARAFLADHRPIHPFVRLVHWVMANDAVRRPVFTLARLARPFARFFAGRSRPGFAAGMLAATAPHRLDGQRRHGGQNHRRAAPSAPPVTSLFTGCIMSDLFGHVHAATERVLRVNGYEVVATAGQGCCGALHAHAGQRDAARALARRNIKAFRNLPDGATIAVNAAGCGAMLEGYAHLLADDPLRSDAERLASRVRDVTELLADKGPRQGGPLEAHVAYDPPCHLLHAQRVAKPPLDVLRAVPGLDRVPHAEAELCCGSAGSYSLAQPVLSLTVLDRKLDALQSTQPDVIATGNPGCLMQIGAGLLARGDRTPVVHPVELLDASYRSAGMYGH
jgi:glycolate dehydrogenase iron-sulfur subunit